MTQVGAVAQGGTQPRLRRFDHGGMAQTLTTLLVHAVFSTKDRFRWLDPQLEPQLFPFASSIAANHGSRCLAINGTEDHVHMLLSLSKNMALSALMREIKKGTSRFMKRSDPARRAFEWQDGYGAFSVSKSHLDVVREYIARQKEHHRKFTFEQEYLELLRRHETEYDERYVFG